MELLFTFVQYILIGLTLLIGISVAFTIVRVMLRWAGWDLVIALKPYDVSREYPKDWARVRRVVLERDGYQCRNCGNPDELHVHHVVPLRSGGTNRWSNLITLCHECHARLHPHMYD
jgi:5-methylcytosine-specific restriction endonuclease McrA